jgi:serine protease
MNASTFARLLLTVAAVALTATPALPGDTQMPGATPVTAQVAASTAVDDPSGARVIVKYKAQGTLMRSAASAGWSGKGPRHANTLAGRTGLALSDGRVIDRHSQVVHGGKGISSAALAERLAGDADVEYAVPDQRRHALAVPSDPLFAASNAISPVVGQWYLRAPDATFVSAINAVGAWAISTGSASVVVADLDTGVRFDHPDLAIKLYPGYDFVTGITTAVDGTARDADASDPGDWTLAGECGVGKRASTSSWHGTQTAGIIGAQTDNGIGMASVGRNVMLLPVRVLGKCGGSDSDIIAAMLWAGGLPSDPNVPTNTHPARVINLSLGAPGSCSQAYKDAITQLTAAGVVVVVAAGNDEGLAVQVPGNCPGVIAVSAVRNVGTKVGFSSIGPEVSLSAPGGNCINTKGPCLYLMLSTTNSGTQSAVNSSYTDSVNFEVGTSFSAPLVSGTAALMISANPALTTAQVTTMLQSTARAFATTSTDPTLLQCHAPDGTIQDECLCTTSTCGAGLLDAAAAVAAAAATAPISARLSASTSAVVVGSTVDFDASTSVANGGHTITSFLWEVTSGASIAGIAVAGDGRTAKVTGKGIGNFVVQLTVTDNLGQTASTSSIVSVHAVPAPSDSGGGAMQVGWLAGLAMAVLALAWRRRDRQSVAQQVARERT